MALVNQQINVRPALLTKLMWQFAIAWETLYISWSIPVHMTSFCKFPFLYYFLNISKCHTYIFTHTNVCFIFCLLVVYLFIMMLQQYVSMKIMPIKLIWIWEWRNREDTKGPFTLRMITITISSPYQMHCNSKANSFVFAIHEWQFGLRQKDEHDTRVQNFISWY